MVKGLLQLATSVILVLANAGPAGADGLSVRVGAYQNRPKIFIDAKGAVRGFFADMMEHIATEEDWDIKWTPGTWEQCLTRLEQGELDLMVDVAYSAERAERFDFQKETFLNNWAQLYVPQGTEIASILELEGKRLAVMRGDISYNDFSSLLSRFGVSCQYIEVDEFLEIFEILDRREADAGLISRILGLEHEDEYHVDKSPIVSNPHELRVAATKGRHADLLGTIDNHLRTLKKNKSSLYFQSLNRWLQVEQHYDEATPSWLWWALGLLGGAGVLLLVHHGLLHARVRSVTRELRQQQENLEDRVRERTAQLETANQELESVNSVILRWDAEGRVLSLNEYGQRLFGFSEAELRGRSVIGTIVPERATSGRDLVAMIEGILRDPARYEVNENENMRKDGSRIWIAWRNKPICDEEGRLREILSLGIDITDRKRAEVELERERDKAQLYLDIAGTIIVAIGADERVTLINKKGCELLCGTKAQIAGMNWFENFIPQRQQEDVRKAFKMLMAGELAPVEYHENAIRTCSGEERMIAWFNTLLRDDGGTIIGTLSSGVDITERNRMAEALQRSEQLYRSLVDNATEGIFVAQGEYLRFVNPMLEQMTGYTKEELTTTPLIEFIYPDDREMVIGRYRARLAGQQVEDRYAFRITHKNGDPRWVNVGSVLIDWNGQPGTLNFLIDITEHKQADEALRQANADLQQAYGDLKTAQTQLVQSEKMASLGNLVAGVAHEINTPIGAVSSMHDTALKAFARLKTLLQAAGNQELRTQAGPVVDILDDANKIIAEGSSRVAEIVKRLRSFARLDEAERKTVDIHEGLEDTLTLIYHQTKHGITIIRDYGKLPPISCYPSRLNQVFLNLLVNAVQAMDGKGEIRITTWAEDHRVSVRITDTGKGIPPAYLSKVFDPGFTTKGVGVGTGLGLSICYRIIQDHGGEISVESEPGKGTSFTVILPRTPAGQ